MVYGKKEDVRLLAMTYMIQDYGYSKAMWRICRHREGGKDVPRWQC